MYLPELRTRETEGQGPLQNTVTLQSLLVRPVGVWGTHAHQPSMFQALEASIETGQQYAL